MLRLSDQIQFYKQSGNSETDLDTIDPKGDIFIEMSGKYDFKVTRESIEMMEAESKVIVISHTMLRY